MVTTPVKAGEASGAPPAEVISAVVRVTAPVRPFHDATPAVPAEIALATNAVVATWVLLVPAVGVGAVTVPVKAGLATGAPPAPVTSAGCRVTAPVRPLKLATPEVAAVTAAVTNAVVAICPLLVPGAAVGAVGMPARA